MMTIPPLPPRLLQMLLAYLVAPLLQALGSGLAGLVRRGLDRAWLPKRVCGDAAPQDVAKTSGGGLEGRV